MAHHRPVLLTFRMLELVDAEHGHWCDECFLPSAVKVTLVSQVDGHPMKLSTGLRCPDHGWMPTRGGH